ncbi:MAG: hypothetical protein R6V05_14420 [Candidatus Brocadiia bacterium]
MTDTEDKYYADMVVAAIDILGFRALLECDDECEAAMQSAKTLIENAPHQYVYDSPDMGTPCDRLYKDWLHLGDALYLFGDPQASIADQALGLMAKSVGLLCLGFRLWSGGERGRLIRVGVARGDLRVAGSIDGREAPIRLGSAMSRAYRLERDQEWIGGAIDSTIPVLSEEQYRIQYDVPLKDGSEWQGHCKALNWVAAAAQNPDFLDVEPVPGWFQDAAAQEKDERVSRKYCNTAQFVTHALSALSDARGGAGTAGG